MPAYVSQVPTYLDALLSLTYHDIAEAGGSRYDAAIANQMDAAGAVAALGGAATFAGTASGFGTGLGVPSVATAGSFSLDNGVQSTGGFDNGSQGGSDMDAPSGTAGSAGDGRGAASSSGGFTVGSLAGSAAGFGSGVGTPSAATAGSFSTGNGVQPTGAFVSSPAVPGQSATSPTGILDIGTVSVFAYGMTVDEDAVAPAATSSDSGGGAKPILVDLDGDGLEIAAADDNFVLFDTDDTGLIHRTAWAGKGDGVLFFDADGDGTISAAREYIFTEWDPTAGGDMEALPSHRHPGMRRRAKRDGAYPGSMPRRSRHAVWKDQRRPPAISVARGRTGAVFSIVPPDDVRRGMDPGYAVHRFARTPFRDDEGGGKAGRGGPVRLPSRGSVVPPSASLRSAPPPTSWGWRMGGSGGGGLSSTPRSGGGGGVAKRRRRGGAPLEDLASTVTTGPTEGRCDRSCDPDAGAAAAPDSSSTGSRTTSVEAWIPDTPSFASLGRRSG